LGKKLLLPSSPEPWTVVRGSAQMCLDAAGNLERVVGAGTRLKVLQKELEF